MRPILLDVKRKRLPKRVKAAAPEEKDFKASMFPCPACDVPLKAREWNGKTIYQHRTEVQTPYGYVLVKTSG